MNKDILALLSRYIGTENSPANIVIYVDEYSSGDLLKLGFKQKGKYFYMSKQEARELIKNYYKLPDYKDYWQKERRVPQYVR